MYLVAIMDWYSKKVLSWTLSNTLESDFCISCLQKAITDHGCPKIFNTDQGSQYTSEACIDVLRQHDIKISMDGKGCFNDNIFMERLWRSVKYELVYIRDFESVKALKKGLSEWFDHYNQEQFHQGLNYKTPDEAYKLADVA